MVTGRFANVTMDKAKALENKSKPASAIVNEVITRGNLVLTTGLKT